MSTTTERGAAMIDSLSRRHAFGLLGGSLAPPAASPVLAGPAPSEVAGSLATLIRQLKLTPRRRGFKDVPFMLTDPLDWDDQAARLLLGYGDRTKQVGENT